MYFLTNFIISIIMGWPTLTNKTEIKENTRERESKGKNGKKNNNEEQFLWSTKTVICLDEEESIGDFSKEITGTEV